MYGSISVNFYSVAYVVNLLTNLTARIHVSPLRGPIPVNLLGVAHAVHLSAYLTTRMQVSPFRGAMLIGHRFDNAIEAPLESFTVKAFSICKSVTQMLSTSVQFWTITLVPHNFR